MISGHAIRVRSQFVRSLGYEHMLEWTDKFNRGGSSTTDSPSLEGTLLGGVSLLAFHDVYPVGQLGMLRANAGLSRLVG